MVKGQHERAHCMVELNSENRTLLHGDSLDFLGQ